MKLLPHQTFGYALKRAIEYYGPTWYQRVTIELTRHDGYLILMSAPKGN
jgi:hypothetical protein